MQSLNGDANLRMSDCTPHPSFRQPLVSQRTSSTLWGLGGGYWHSPCQDSEFEMKVCFDRMVQRPPFAGIAYLGDLAGRDSHTHAEH